MDKKTYRGMPEAIQRMRQKGYEQSEILDKSDATSIDRDAELQYFGIDKKDVLDRMNRLDRDAAIKNNDDKEEEQMRYLGIDESQIRVDRDSPMKYPSTNQTLYNKMYWSEKTEHRSSMKNKIIMAVLKEVYK